MSTNQWPDLKKEMDNIPVPLDKLDVIIAETMTKNRTKPSKKKAVLYSVSAAVVGFSLFIGSASVFPVMAKISSNIPIIGTFFNDSADEGLRIAGVSGLTKVVDQSSKDNGITLTMNEIFYDGTRLTLGYTHESLFAIGELERPTIKVDGKEINFSSSYSGDFVTPQKYKGIIDITPTEELPEAFEMTISFDAVGLVPGQWGFHFPVEQSSEVTVIRPQETKTIEGLDVEISSLKIGPAGTDVKVQVKQEEATKLTAYDLNFYVIDDNGRVLNTVTGGGFGETVNGVETTTLDFLYSPIAEGTKTVRVVPYTIPMTEQGLEQVEVSLEEKEVPFVVDQGEFGSILVTKVDVSEEKTVVYFTLNSDAIVDEKLSQNPIWMEDANGNNLIVEDKPFAERVEGNKFKQEFKAGEGLKIKSYKYLKPVMYEEFIIDVSGL